MPVAKPALKKGLEFRGATSHQHSDICLNYRFTNPDGRSGMVTGDVRLCTCTLAGPGGQQFQNMGPNNGASWCRYQTGERGAVDVRHAAVSQDWGILGMRILNRRPRPDLSQESSQAAAAYRLKVRDSWAEGQFEGTRQGAAVTGKIVGFTQCQAGVDPNLLAGTSTTQTYAVLGPRESEPALSAGRPRMQGATRWNVQWVMANRVESRARLADVDALSAGARRARSAHG